jgi:hypothetical protein
MMNNSGVVGSAAGGEGGSNASLEKMPKSKRIFGYQLGGFCVGCRSGDGRVRAIRILDWREW